VLQPANHGGIAPSTQKRFRGALLGLATGDALGTTVEFEPPGSFEPVTDLVGGGIFQLEPGEWTDDTSMALCLAESLVETGALDAVDQLRRYERWWRNGHLSSTGVRFDIGDQTRAALEQFERTGEPYPGSSDPADAGNGSIARLAPVPLRYAARPALAISRSGESSRTTHGCATCVDACRYLGALIVGAVEGRPKEELLDPTYELRPDDLVPQIAAIADGSFACKEPPEIRGRGFVVDSLEAALWAFAHDDAYADVILTAVNLGDDADTTAAVCGQLAGTFYGEDAIPAEWRERLALRGTIEELADALHDAAAV
jgi:ADP-ribosyl-[dinitrogen reductase] hydrolase